MKLGYSWKYGPFELLTITAKNGWNAVIKNADLMHIPLPQYLANKEYQKIDKQKFNSHKDILQESQIVLENSSAKLILYQDVLIFVITTKMNCLNHEVFYLLQEAASKAENDGKNLYIYPQGNNFSAGADLKLLLSYIEDKNFHDLENLLKLGQQTMLHLKYSSVHVISLWSWCVALGVGLVPGWGGVTAMFARSNGNKTKLIRNISNIIEKNKTSSADYFKADYDVENMHVNMNKHYILEEALKLNLPKKIVPIPHKITYNSCNWLLISDKFMPFAYKDIIFCSNPSILVCFFETISGSNLPCLSLGIFSSIEPFSLIRFLLKLPFLAFSVPALSYLL
ncbi:putative fatty acid oxidation complex trifunctional enzyme domain protein [Rickettsia argasii T170-B]|uniref:Putative fatty acid oxidation complex trifunctional enzyme domain protein n=2 Tax=spotted fever group TaxID=114277 RepID=A0A0F3RCG3_9RICK|nr:putative fatty acid oxidation complex trifunctional enzyme domain protein [Rickettsia argasii T170-B]